jgi:hypothetical protein
MTHALSNAIPILGNLDALMRCLGAEESHGVDGIDLDGEPMFYRVASRAASFISANAILHQWTKARRSGSIVSWAPYADRQSWQALAEVVSPHPDWINLQPSGWGRDAQVVRNWATRLGLPLTSVVPGFHYDDDIQSTLAGLVKQDVPVTGAYIWRYDDLIKNGLTVASYAEAISKGLQGISP